MNREEREAAVDWFAERLKARLCEPRNLAKGSWHAVPLARLQNLLKAELTELVEALRSSKSDTEIVDECCDVAAFCLMIADICQRRMLAEAALKTCCTCRRELDLKAFCRNPVTKDGLSKQCRSCSATSGKKIRLANRLEALRRYSSGEPKCACCGEAHWEFLAIDHINGGGRQQALKNGFTLARWLKQNNWPTGFQVLCHNCNMAKGFYGVCPHQTGPSTRMSEAEAHSRKRGGDRKSAEATLAIADRARHLKER